MGEIPARVKNIHDLLRDDITAREKIGDAEYGQPLLPFNGRNSILDAYEECLDMAVYLRQEIEERKVLSEQIASLQETLGGLGHEVSAPAEDRTSGPWASIEDVPTGVPVYSRNGTDLVYRRVASGEVQYESGRNCWVRSGSYTMGELERYAPWYEVEQ